MFFLDRQDQVRVRRVSVERGRIAGASWLVLLSVSGVIDALFIVIAGKISSSFLC